MSTFESVKINQALNFGESENSNAGICNSNMIGAIELFNSTTIPDNYIICDGSKITTDDNSEYETLIYILTNDDSVSSAYLPDFSSETFPLGWSENSNNNKLSSYKSKGNANNTGKSSLDTNYFPSHSHTIKGSISVEPTTDNSYVKVNITGDSQPKSTGSSGSVSSVCVSSTTFSTVDSLGSLRG